MDEAYSSEEIEEDDSDNSGITTHDKKELLQYIEMEAIVNTTQLRPFQNVRFDILSPPR